MFQPGCFACIHFYLHENDAITESAGTLIR